MTKHKNISYSKTRKRTVLQLHNVEFVQEGNRVTMSWEWDKNNCFRNTLPQTLTENKCHSITSEDGKSVLISCSELGESDLNIGVSKRSFTKSQHDLLAVGFILYPNPPFKDMSIKISERSKLFREESVTKIQKWFQYNYRTFKIGRHPGWAIDPDTKQIRYHSLIDEDGRMKIYKRYPRNDVNIPGRSNKSTSYDVIKKETHQNCNRKINRDLSQEYIQYSGEKSTTDCTVIPIPPTIKQEPIDYEFQPPRQLPSNYKIPKLPNVAIFPHSNIHLSQIKQENSLPCTTNAYQPSEISSKCCNRSGYESESNSKNKSFGSANSQLFATHKTPNNKRKKRIRRKPKKFTDGDLSHAKMAELQTTLQSRQQIAAKGRK